MNLRDSLAISQSKVVLVEGQDEVRLLGQLVNCYDIQSMQIVEYQGKYNFASFLKTFKSLSEFDRIEKLAIAMDANMDYQAAVNRITGALASAELPVPQRGATAATNGTLAVVYLVLPDGGSTGNLEDVCLASVGEDPAIRCVDDYLKCIAASSLSGPKESRRSKAKAHAFLASRPDGNLRLGEAAEAGIWPFYAQAFDPLRNLLMSL